MSCQLSFGLSPLQHCSPSSIHLPRDRRASRAIVPTASPASAAVDGEEEIFVGGGRR